MILFFYDHPHLDLIDQYKFFNYVIYDKNYLLIN